MSAENTANACAVIFHFSLLHNGTLVVFCLCFMALFPHKFHPVMTTITMITVGEGMRAQLTCTIFVLNHQHNKYFKVCCSCLFLSSFPPSLLYCLPILLLLFPYGHQQTLVLPSVLVKREFSLPLLLVQGDLGLKGLGFSPLGYLLC